MGFACNGTQRLLVYEYLSGGDVSRRLQKCARDGLPFSYQQRLSVALDAACGLSHLHNSSPKVFHRDIKTANILLDRNGGAKMADFGLACLSRTTEHKVKQASGTIGYACPYYIQRGVVTEGSEVYSFGMVLIELMCNAPPACAGSSPGEVLYLVNHLQGSVSRCVSMADPKAGWPPAMANKLAELCMNCVSMTETSRPKFTQVVKQLRVMLEVALKGGDIESIPTNPSSPMVRKKSMAPEFTPGVELIRLECVVCPSNASTGVGRSIIHTCTESEASGPGSLPPLKVGRHCQPTLFDALVQTDALKGTISREHFVISFQPVTRSAERLFHATLTNHSINSVAVDGKHLEKGQSAFVYQGDVISFLALPTGGNSVPQPFLSFRVDITNPVVQAVRPKAVPTSPSGLVRVASSHSIPEAASLNASAMYSDDGVDVTHVGGSELVGGSNAMGSVHAFYLIAKSNGEILGVKDPTVGLRVGRSFQSESFWRQLAPPEACPAISRDHFSINAVKEQSGWKFYLTCNSINGLTLVSPNLSVFITKDTPGVHEISDGTGIELGGAIQFSFRENLNAQSVGSTEASKSSAAVLRPPIKFANSAVSSYAPLIQVGSVAGSLSSLDNDDFPEDAFSKTGFR